MQIAGKKNKRKGNGVNASYQRDIASRHHFGNIEKNEGNNRKIMEKSEVSKNGTDKIQVDRKMLLQKCCLGGIVWEVLRETGTGITEQCRRVG